MRRLWILPRQLSCALLLCAAAAACGGDAARSVPTGGARNPGGGETLAQRGEAQPFAGYTLFQPLRSTSIYLVDLDGDLAHQWETDYNPGQSVYLLDSGNLLRTARDPDPPGMFRGGGEGGILQEIAWDGTVVWEYRFSGDDARQHHDIEPMPNGNVLIIAWEARSYEEAVAAGINPARMQADYIWPDFIVEVEPVYPDGGKIVWEWHAWDHLVQELYRDKDNYGIAAEHPELIDINAAAAHRARQEMATPESVDRLRSLGYIAGNAASDDRPEIEADWIHSNAIDYNAELDQIMLTSRSFSEIWIIDHSTTTEEAAGHSGGRHGRGGDLLYRWGNPEAWGAGGAGDRALFGPHDARWIEPGRPGAGNILVFNNGAGRPDLNYSSVLEIAPPMTPEGAYLMEPGSPTGPAAPLWEYAAPDPQSLFAANVSGAQRLPNGNTLVGAGSLGRMLEVGANNAVVWEYTNPFIEDEDRISSDRIGRAFGAPPGPPEGGRVRGGRRGPPPGPPEGGGARGAFFRATRIAADHPGLAALRSTNTGGN